MNQTKWGQKEGEVIVTIIVHDDDQPSVDIQEKSLSFKNGDFHFEFDLYDDVDLELSHWEPHGRECRVHLVKVKDEDWPRLTSDKAKHPWLSVDWRYIDDSSEDY